MINSVRFVLRKGGHDVDKSRLFFLSTGVIGRHKGKGLVPAWHLINCSSIFISLNQSGGRSGVITSWVWAQSHLIVPTVLDLQREKQSDVVEEVWERTVLKKNRAHSVRLPYRSLLQRSGMKCINSNCVLFVFFSLKLTKSCIIVCPQQKEGLKYCQYFTSQMCNTIPDRRKYLIKFGEEGRWEYCHKSKSNHIYVACEIHILSSKWELMFTDILLWLRQKVSLY